jgi:hypothetical protein
MQYDCLFEGSSQPLDDGQPVPSLDYEDRWELCITATLSNNMNVQGI